MSNQVAQSLNKRFVGRALTLAGLIVFIAPVALAGDRLVAAQYEMTSTRDGKTTTSTYCATPEIAKGTNGDAHEVQAYLDKSVKTCKITSLDVSGDTINYSMTCSGSTTSTSIRVVYHGDHFEGNMTNNFGGKTSIAHTTAKRVGDCNPEGQ
jgi:hypothetical protein